MLYVTDRKCDDSRASVFERLYTVPRRYDLATLFTVAVACVLLLAVLCFFRGHSVIGTGLIWLCFAMVAGFCAFVGFAQALLFKGNDPLSASMLGGAVYLSATALAVNIWMIGYEGYLPLILRLLFASLVGAIAGSFACVLNAGVFLVADLVRTTRGVTRFSLRTLLMTVAAVSIVLAAFRWNILLGAVISFAIAVAFVVTGARKQHRVATMMGVLLAVGAVAFLVLDSVTYGWTSRHKLDVHVIVVDASTLTPIADAKVEVLFGPRSPMEGPPPNVNTDFELAETLHDPGGLVTNNDGCANFTHEFQAVGTDGLFRDSGYVVTGRTWVRVTATGYHATYMPIDGQSVRARDINDDTPVFVTVPISKR